MPRYTIRIETRAVTDLVVDAPTRNAAATVGGKWVDEHGDLGTITRSMTACREVAVTREPADATYTPPTPPRPRRPSGRR